MKPNLCGDCVHFVPCSNCIYNDEECDARPFDGLCAKANATCDFPPGACRAIDDDRECYWFVAKTAGEFAEVRGAGCQYSDDDACRFVRERDAARAEVAAWREACKGVSYQGPVSPAGLTDLIWSLHEDNRMAREEIAGLKAEVAQLEAALLRSGGHS